MMVFHLSPLRIVRLYAALLTTLVVAVWIASTGSVDAEGRYFRAGIGLEKLSETEFTDVDCNNPGGFISLYGCGSGNDGRSYRGSFGKFGTTNLIDFGLGYETNSSLRYELLFEYRPRNTFRGEANYNYNISTQSFSANLSSITGMFAFFIDFKKPEMEQKIEPFIGAGIGSVHHKIKKQTLMFPGTSTLVPDSKNTAKAWMVTSGVGITLDEKITLDIAWRYTDLGRVMTKSGGGQVVRNRDGTISNPDLNLAPTHTRLRGQGIRISIRRKF